MGMEKTVYRVNFKNSTVTPKVPSSSYHNKHRDLRICFPAHKPLRGLEGFPGLPGAPQDALIFHEKNSSLSIHRALPLIHFEIN